MLFDRKLIDRYASYVDKSLRIPPTQKSSLANLNLPYVADEDGHHMLPAGAAGFFDML